MVMHSLFFAKKLSMVQASKTSIIIMPQAYIIAAIMLLTLPIRWVIGWMISAVAHELGHFVAVRLCGKRIQSVCIGFNGAEIISNPMADWETVLCTLAGPAAGLMLLALGRWYPELAVCAFVQSVFNLLPIYPLDGGRVLRVVIRMLFSVSAAERIILLLEWVVCFAVLTLGIAATFIFHFGILPLGISVCLLVKMKMIKRPCK